MEIKEELISFGDPEKVSRIMQILGVTNDDFKDPIRTERVKDVINYLQNHPDPDYFIYKAVGSKQIDRVDFMHEYVNLRRELDVVESRAKNLKEQIEIYEK